MKTKLSDILTLPVLLGIGVLCISILLIIAYVIASMPASTEPHDLVDTPTPTMVSIATVTPVSTPKLWPYGIISYTWNITATETISVEWVIGRRTMGQTASPFGGQSMLFSMSPQQVYYPIPDFDKPSGRMEITLPSEMIVEENDIITLEIIAAKRYTATNKFSPHVTGIIRIDQEKYEDGSRIRLEDEIRLYPTMFAELLGNNFEIDGEQRSPRTLNTGSAAWVWHVKAIEAGTHSISIQIYGEFDEDGETVSTLERSSTQEIVVRPKGFFHQLGGLTPAEWLALIGTNGGILGIVITIHGVYQAKKNNEMDEMIDGLQGEIDSMKNGEKEDIEILVA